MPADSRVFSGLGFDSFSEQRLELLSGPDSFIDAANTALYQALPGRYPDRFVSIQASSHSNAPYRCHLVEAMLAHLGLVQEEWKGRALASQGVRASLSLLWASPALKSRRHWIPTDVYPVYQALALEAGIDWRGYEARHELPWEELAHSTNWCVLVCDPLKPWGNAGTSKLDALVELAQAQDGLVVVDAAYASRLPQTLVQGMTQDAPVAWMWSLSKGWLLPYRAGIVLAPRCLAEQLKPTFARATKSEPMVRQAYAALTDFPHRPDEVMAVVDESRAAMRMALAGLGMSFADPGRGYFLTSPHSAEQWWEAGVLALPASVFGSAWHGSVLSTLGALST